MDDGVVVDEEFSFVSSGFVTMSDGSDDSTPGFNISPGKLIGSVAPIEDDGTVVEAGNSCCEMSSSFFDPVVEAGDEISKVAEVEASVVSSLI